MEFQLILGHNTSSELLLLTSSVGTILYYIGIEDTQHPPNLQQLTNILRYESLVLLHLIDMTQKTFHNQGKLS